MSHPTNRLNDQVHQRVRLGILAILDSVARADFRYLRDTLALTDGNLGRHLEVLEDAGLVTIDKAFEKRKPRTWIKITRAGREEFHAEIDALREIVASAERPSKTERDPSLRINEQAATSSA